MSTIQRITSEYKLETSSVSVDLARDSENFTEIFTVSDFGIIYSLTALFNNSRVKARLVIDNLVSFDVDVDDLDASYGPLFYTNKENSLTFTPRFPIMFRKSVAFYAKANSNSNSRVCKGYTLEYSKE